MMKKLLVIIFAGLFFTIPELFAQSKEEWKSQFNSPLTIDIKPLDFDSLYTSLKANSFGFSFFARAKNSRNNVDYIDRNMPVYKLPKDADGTLKVMKLPEDYQSRMPVLKLKEENKTVAIIPPKK